MFTKIVLPLDLTDRHQPALAIAAEMARQSGGEVTLLHVIEVIAGLSIDEERDFYGRLERTTREHLNRQAKVLADRQIACSQRDSLWQSGPGNRPIRNRGKSRSHRFDCP